MPIFLAFAGFLQIAVTILAVALSTSVMHETLAATTFGFGCVCLGFAAILNRMDKEEKRRDVAAAARIKAEHEAHENERVKKYPMSPVFSEPPPPAR